MVIGVVDVAASLGVVGGGSSSRGASDADVVVTVVMAHVDADIVAAAAAVAVVVVVVDDDASDAGASNVPHTEARPVEHSLSSLAHCHILNRCTPLDSCYHSQQLLVLLLPT